MTSYADKHAPRRLPVGRRVVGDTVGQARFGKRPRQRRLSLEPLESRTVLAAVFGVSATIEPPVVSSDLADTLLSAPPKVGGNPATLASATLASTTLAKGLADAGPRSTVATGATSMEAVAAPAIRSRSPVTTVDIGPYPFQTDSGLIVGSSGVRATIGDIQYGQNVLHDLFPNEWQIPGDLGTGTVTATAIDSGALSTGPGDGLSGQASLPGVLTGAQPLHHGDFGMTMPRIDPDSGPPSEMPPVNHGLVTVDTFDIADRLDGEGDATNGATTRFAGWLFPARADRMTTSGQLGDDKTQAEASPPARAAEAANASVLGRHRTFELAADDADTVRFAFGRSGLSRAAWETTFQERRAATNTREDAAPAGTGDSKPHRPRLEDAALRTPLLLQEQSQRLYDRSLRRSRATVDGEAEFGSPLTDALVFVIGGFGTLVLTRQVALPADERQLRLRR